MLLGHASLAEICGGAPSLEDMQLLSIAVTVQSNAEALAKKKSEPT